MANKMHPGAFRCYEAALPDEPMFVILGRDLAGPATLEFWAQERIKQGKTQEPDDKARIGACLTEASDMRDWRARMIAHAEEVGEPPVWKLPRPLDDDRPPVRSIQTYDERDDTAPGGRVVRAHPALAAPFTQDIRAKIAIGLRQIAGDLHYLANHEGGGIWDKLEQIVDRSNGYAAELEADAQSRDHYAEFAKNLGKPVEHEYYPEPDGDPIKVLPLSFTRMSELLDYATCYGEFDETTPDGTISKYGEGMSSPMNAERRAAIWVYKRCMGVIPEGAEPPVAVEPVPTVTVYRAGLFAVPGVEGHQTMDQIAETYRKLSKTVKGPTVDSAPNDLAHSPEVPAHRFSVFHQGKNYAYARGLEVNPMHLPTALDAMEESGWGLVAIFGQTDAQHVGFIFERVAQFSAFERAHGYGGGFAGDTVRKPGSTFAMPEVAEAYASGKPIEEIVKLADDLGRGQQA